MTGCRRMVSRSLGSPNSGSRAWKVWTPWFSYIIHQYQSNNAKKKKKKKKKINFRKKIARELFLGHLDPHYQEKTCLRGVRPGKSQTDLLSFRSWLESWQLVLYYLGSEQRGRWTNCADAQADLCLCCSQMAKSVVSWCGSFCWMVEHTLSNDQNPYDAYGYILFLHSSYTHWVNPEYCSNFNGIILPLSTVEGHSRVSGRWEYRC